MPKIFSEQERTLIKESMLHVGASLLRKKGIRQVSVGDITKEVNIATGSFYSFYKSKEELLWDIIKHEEQKMVEQILAIGSQDLDLETKIRKIFYDLYLQEDSIVYFLPQEDLEYIVRKIPSEILEANIDNAYSIHRAAFEVCNIDANEENIEISLSMQNIIFTASNSEIPRSKSTRKKVLNILVESFVEYFARGGDAK